MMNCPNCKGKGYKDVMSNIGGSPRIPCIFCDSSGKVPIPNQHKKKYTRKEAEAMFNAMPFKVRMSALGIYFQALKDAGVLDE